MTPGTYSHLVIPSSLCASDDGSILYASYAWDGTRFVCRTCPGETDGEILQFPAGPDPHPCFDRKGIVYLSGGRFRSASGFSFGEEGWMVDGFCLTGNGKAVIKERYEIREEKPYSVVDRLPYRSDADHGMRRNAMRRLLLVTLPEGNAPDSFPVSRLLQESETDWRYPACHENLFVYGQKQWMLLNLEDGEERPLCEDFIPGGFAPVFSADGQFLLAPGYWKGSPDLSLRRIWLDESRPSESVSGLPDTIGRGSVYADLSKDTPSLLTAWKNDFLLVGVSKGVLGLYRISQRGQDLCAMPCLSIPGSVFEVTAAGSFVFILWGDSTHAPRILRLNEGPDAFFPPDHWTGMPDEGAVPSIPVTTPSQDGKADLNARLLLPEGANRHRVPLLVWIHGGPEGFYTDALDVEKQAAVSRGFAVLLPNPRGSTGFGRDYQHTGEEFSDGAARDVLTLLDAVLRQYPCLNPEKVGILGGSYGGFMSAYLAGHTTRFHAAVILKPVTNWLTIHFKSSQSGQPVFADHFSFRDFLADTFRQSPAATADQIQIPTLLIHGGEDQQCPPENSLQFYRLIRAYHPEIPCELKLYSNCCHAYSRDGLADYLSIQEETLKWMETFLYSPSCPKENQHAF